MFMKQCNRFEAILIKTKNGLGSILMKQHIRSVDMHTRCTKYGARKWNSAFDAAASRYAYEEKHEIWSNAFDAMQWIWKMLSKQRNGFGAIFINNTMDLKICF